MRQSLSLLRFGEREKERERERKENGIDAAHVGVFISDGPFSARAVAADTNGKCGNKYEWKLFCGIQNSAARRRTCWKDVAPVAIHKDGSVR